MMGKCKNGKKTGWYIATDSEWDTSLPDPWLSTAFAWVDGGGVKTTVFFRGDLPVDIVKRLKVKAEEMGVVIRWVDRTDRTDLLAKIDPPAGSRLLLYYTPKVVEYALGWDSFKDAIESEKVRQRNNISGQVGDVILKDLVGWAGKSSLVRFAGGLGVPMANKESMDKYKACMMTGLLAEPALYLEYAVGDARVLLKVHDAFVGLIRTVQTECLGMAGSDLWAADDIPMTCGALVAKTFEKWLYSSAGRSEDALKFCVRKLGLLDPDARRYKRGRWAYWSCFKKYRSVESLRAGKDAGDDDLRDFLSAKYLTTGLEGAGIRWWASRPPTETTMYNALVQGGRCLNENPLEYELDHGLDVDISGCYGESLRTLVYPVGLPSVWSFSPNEKRLTLGEWLGKYEDELVDGLWSAVVSGPLGFDQDLIFSKLAKIADIRKAVGEDRDDDDDISTSAVMLRRQVENGIITADVLKALRAVATNHEWRQVAALQVVTAVAYLAKDRKAGVGEWCEAVLGSNGTIDTRWGDTTDRRSRAWYGVPLESFVGKLVDKRRHYKKLAKTSTEEAERVAAAGLDSTLKLLVNTLYGTFASRFFSVGNTVLANNITARARVTATHY